jgi:hypothetical protein
MAEQPMAAISCPDRARPSSQHDDAGTTNGGHQLGMV